MTNNLIDYTFENRQKIVTAMGSCTALDGIVFKTL